MDITEEQITEISKMMDDDTPESKIIAWIDFQDNAQDIFDWFNKFMQGYVTQTKKNG